MIKQRKQINIREYAKLCGVLNIKYNIRHIQWKNVSIKDIIKVNKIISNIAKRG